MRIWDVLLWTANSRGSQVFLGAPWIPLTIELAPKAMQRSVALHWMAISPHYNFRTPLNKDLSTRAFLESEFNRNMSSRKIIIENVVRPYLQPHYAVLDYGCGPGFLATNAAPYARQIIACDISRGILACAGALNNEPNIEFLLIPPSGRLNIEPESVDLVYSFAVFQHLEDAVIRKSLGELARVMKPGAKGLIHVILTGTSVHRSEAECQSDRSLMGRAQWRFGLHCFARTPEEITGLVSGAGFSEISIEPVNVPQLEDDVAHQHLLLFRKPAKTA